MNNDTPQPHNAFNGDAQPNQPAPRFAQERRAPQHIDSFVRPQNRPMQSPAPHRPRQDITYLTRSPYGAQPQPQPQPVQDPSFAPSPRPQQPMQDPSFAPAPQPRPIENPNYSQPQPVQDPSFAPSPRPQQPMQPAQSPQQSSPQANSIYPSATSGVAAATPAQPAPQQNAKKQTGLGRIEHDTIVTLVMVFGGFMVLVSALSLLTWLNLGLKTASSVIGLLIGLFELSLGVGIIMKREVARFTYVIVACISLVFSIIGTVSYLSQQTKDHNPQSSQMIGLQQAISKYQNDDSLSASQKAKYINVLQNSEAVVEKQQATIDNAGKVLVPLRNIIIGYVIAILPIAFLTRPSVKKVFS